MLCGLYLSFLSSPDEAEFSIADNVTVGAVRLPVKVEVDVISKFITLKNPFVAQI